MTINTKQHITLLANSLTSKEFYELGIEEISSGFGPSWYEIEKQKEVGDGKQLSVSRSLR